MKRILYRDAGDDHLRFDVYIDGEMVKAMARKAAASKTGKCTDGPLQVVITRQSKVWRKLRAANVKR
jgi:hypothetical protein